MKKIIIALFLASFILAMSCNSSEQETPNTTVENPSTDAKILSKGFQLMNNHCTSCHSLDHYIENPIAPPLGEIKMKYTVRGESMEQFTEDLITFLNNPTEDNAKIPNAVASFGVMPNLGFSEEQITAVATYMYVATIEKASWLDMHYKKEKEKYSKVEEPTSLLAQGKSFAMKTKSVLGKNLLGAIKNKGTQAALSFCSSSAYPLTDSMSILLDAKIKRVSDKNRNPKNLANEAELAYILAAQATLKEGGKIMPKITKNDAKATGYYPIMTNKMCMQCHGKKESEILPKTLAKIKELYPDDKATGYSTGQLRGIWVVEMKDK